MLSGFEYLFEKLLETESLTEIEVDRMTDVMFPRKSALLMLLFGCVMLVFMTSLQAAAEGENNSCMAADLKGYAELDFCLPPEVVVNPEAITVANYSEGREVRASMLFNDSNVFLHLLYPCPAPTTLLEPADLHSRIEAFAPVLGTANYSSTELNITGRPALWGQMENTIFVAYQPANQTIALLLMDGRLNETVMASFLEYLQIAINESKSPLGPGYCNETTTALPQAPESVKPVTNASLLPKSLLTEDNELAESTALTESNPLMNNSMLTDNNPPVTNNTSATEASQEKFEAGKARMAADMQAAEKKLEQAKKELRGF
jgi:hypothetical protein